MRYTSFLKNEIVSPGVYDKTKASTFGNIYQKTIESETCFGPASSGFVDVQTDFIGIGGLTQAGPQHVTVNNRIFITSPISGNIGNIAMYTRNPQTLKTTLVGRLQYVVPNSPATTHTITGIRVIDNGTTGWRIFISTRPTGTNATRNGGFLEIYNVGLSDFSMAVVPTIIYHAISSGVKGSYFHQDPTIPGVLHEMGSVPGAGIIGIGLNPASTELIALKNTAASFSSDAIDVTATPTITTYPSTSPVANGTASVFTVTGHPFQNNDALVITLAPPTGFTLTTQTAIQTVYFIRNRTANTFELTATFGGASSILGTSVTSPTFVRAFGISTNMYIASRKSGTIASGFLGTALLVDSLKVVTMADGPNAGEVCVFLPTSSNFYCFRLSDLTAGATTIPTASGINALGTGIDYVAPTVFAATYSEILGKVIFTSAAFAFYMKSWVNNSISHAFGSQISLWLENDGKEENYFRGFVVTGLDVKDGVIYVSMNTVGQRGILYMDARSDATFDFSYLTSPVKFIGPSNAKFITTLEKLFESTDNTQVFVRSANTSSDPIFNTDVGGWIAIQSVEDLSAINLAAWAQMMCKWDTASFLSGNPAQVSDIILGHDRFTDMGHYFVGMSSGTTDDVPSYVVYRQIEVFPVAPSTLYHRAYDDSFNLVESLNTTANVAQVTHSTDEGLTWNAGVGPNQFGKRLRFERLTPPAVVVQNSLKEI